MQMISLGRDSRTYHFRDTLKGIGGRFDFDSKCWLVPADRHSEAIRMISDRRETSPPLRLVQQHEPAREFPPTAEQALFFQIFEDSGDDIVGNAYAGTGKTTTMEMLARKFPRQRFLYIVYNKKNSKEAKARFPKNVRAMTAHALAFNGLDLGSYPDKKPRKGYDYTHVFDRLHARAGGLPGLVARQYMDVLREIVTLFEESIDEVITMPYRIGLLLSAVQIASGLSLDQMIAKADEFCAKSGTPAGYYTTFLYNMRDFLQGKKRRNLIRFFEKTESHVLRDFVTYHSVDADVKEAVHDFLQQVERHARDFFRILTDFDNEVPMGFNTYLKLYQLKKPVINGFAAIMFDEAQDANPVMLDIIMRQSARKIWVGDRHQAIYQFNGAVNTIDDLIGSGATVVPLTKSFRFGPNIADAGNRVLDLKYRYFKEKYPRGSIGRIEGAGKSKGDGKRVILCRSNVGVLEAALASKGPVFFGDCLPEECLRDMLDIHDISQGQPVRREESPYKGFTSFDDLKSEAETARDIDTCRAISILERYGAQRFREAVESLLASGRSGEDAPLHIITAHRAKGMEWSHVTVAADFVMRFYCFDKKTGELLQKKFVPEDEVNLLYVAVTRAMDTVSLPLELEELLGFERSD
jgi:hypothetical protein